MSGDSLVPIAQGTIRLLCVNDVYCDYPINRRGGYAELATLLKQYRRPDDPNTLFLVNGDVLGGSALAEMFHGDWVIELLNHLGTDAACIGTRDLSLALVLFFSMRTRLTRLVTQVTTSSIMVLHVCPS